MKKMLWTVAFVVGFFFLLASNGHSKPPKKTPELLKEGNKIFEQTCASCHGNKGDGKGPAAAALKPPPTDFRKPLREWPNTKGNLEKVFEVISKGIPGSGMIAWSQYSDQQRWGLAYVVRGFAAPAKKR
jgi:high-affinity iron transporter